MRATVTVLVLLLAPAALAGVAAAGPLVTGGSVGVNGGYASAGVWDLHWFVIEKEAGTTAATLNLTWAPSLFPGADYDLRLYREGALEDDVLQDEELLAESSTRSFSVRAERLEVTLAPGQYVVAVVPFQAQRETYTLRSDVGDLQRAAYAPGFCLGC